MLGYLAGNLVGRREGREAARVALVQAILWVLKLRRVGPSADARARIVRCRNLPTLARWLDEVLAGADAEALA